MKLSLLFIPVIIFYSQEISFSAFVDGTTINTKESFKLHMEFSWIGNPQDFKIEVSDKTQFYGLEKLGSGSANKLSNTDQGQLCRKSITYQFRAIRTGPVSIEKISAIAIHTVSGKEIELQSDRINLNVIEYVEPFKMTTKLWSAVIGAVILIGFLVLVYIWQIRKKKLELELLTKETVKQPEQIILENLGKVKNDPDKSSESLKQFIMLFEDYLASDLISKENINLSNQPLSFSTAAFIEKIDLFRFSGLNTDIFELEEIMNQFRELLNKNLDIRLKLETK